MYSEKINLRLLLAFQQNQLLQKLRTMGIKLIIYFFKKANDFKLIPLSLDELDVTNTAQLLLFTKEVNAKFKVFEEVAL